MILQQRFEVQRHRDDVYVVRQGREIPRPGPDELVLQMVGCGICGADIRVITGDKAASGEAAERYTTLGHEGVGRVVALGQRVSGWQPGDYAVVLPHVHRSKQEVACTASRINPVCIGGGHTLHMGWETDGCFSEHMVVPKTNVVRIEQQQLRLAAERAPDLREAIFALVEPMLCTLSAYELMKKHLQSDLPAGRALVVGCGPIGILHSLVLLKYGFEVWIRDTVQKRAKLAQWCLDQRVRIFEPQMRHVSFDLAMVTASYAAAIKTGEEAVRKGGTVYLFAGLNTADRAAMNEEGIFLYEPVHRKAQGLRTTLRSIHEERPVLYLGHSGYYENLASQAISMVAANAAALDRTVTGIIPGFTSSRIISRLPGGVDWTTPDASPAIVSILKGTNLQERHSKLLVCPEMKEQR